jgi:transposase
VVSQLPKLSDLSSYEKDVLNVRLFNELQQLQRSVKSLQDRVVSLEAENYKLREEVKELTGKLAKNSSNSSKPPSTDGYQKPKPKSLRKPSGKSPGGQQGHPGARLERVETPDHTVIHPVKRCQKCGESLEQIPVSGKEPGRQVIDIPPLKLETSEHQIEIKTCPCCNFLNKATYPEEAKTDIQYGARIKSFAIYLNQYQFLPYDRIKEMFGDLFSQTISCGTLYRWNKECYRKLESTEQKIRRAIINSEVGYFDETGIRREEALHWLHNASTSWATCYILHARRGQEAMDELGVLPEFTGVAVHDHWKPYFKYFCEHALCNAHHLRELVYLVEQDQQQWASSMITLLLEAKKVCEAASENCLATDSPELASIFLRYDEILQAGFAENIPPPKPKAEKKKRGRPKQSKAKNMLDRLRDFKPQVLAFLTHPLVAFDNNQAERDVRMVKVKQKISGTFRSEEGGDIFCRIRGYISTQRKNGLSILTSLESVLQNAPILPARIATAE